MNLDHLITKREATWAAAQDIITRAERDERSLTSDELTTHSDLLETIRTIDATLSARDAQLALEVQAARPVQAGRSAQPGAPETSAQTRRVPATASDEYRDQFLHYLRTGEVTPEFRAYTVGTDTAGGHLVPDEWAASIVRKLREINVIRQYANVISTSTGILHVPVETSTGSAAWTSEGGAYNESEDVFGEVLLDAHKATRIVKVSEELLSDNSYDVEGYIAQTFAESFADLEEAAFINGDGSGKPRGFLQDAATGTTASATNAITFDEITDLFYSLKPAYRRNGVWLMSDTTLKMLAKIKTGVASDNRYIWRENLQGGTPPTLLGRPVISTYGMPAPTSGLKPVAFGDFSYFWVAERAGTEVRRLNERYAELGLIGIKGMRRVDSELTQSEAVKALVMNT